MTNIPLTIKTPNILTVGDALIYALLVPGFFVYNLLLVAGAPPVFGGYIGFLSVMGFLYFIMKYAIGNFDRHFLRRLIPWFILVLYSICYLLVFISSADAVPENLYSFINASIIFIGYLAAFSVINFKCRQLLAVIITGHAFMTLIVISNVERNTFSLGVSDLEVTYQSFGVLYSLSAILLSILIKNTSLSVFILSISIVALFFNGARTEFGICLIFLVAFLVQRRALFYLTVPAFLSLLASERVFRFVEQFRGNRIIDLVETGALGSRTGREQAMHDAWVTIQQNPLLGSPGSYPSGLYAHNVLSAWVDLGILGMVLYIFLTLQSGIGIYLLKTNADSAGRLIGLALIIAVLISFLFKAYFYILLAPLIGLAISWRSQGGGSK